MPEATPVGKPAAAPSRKLGRYELLAEIASGGMGTVLLARLDGVGGFQRLFAVKLLHPQYVADGEFIAMLLDEARIAARIHHPNVVGIQEVNEAEEHGYYLVMDYVEGFSLWDISQHAEMPQRERWRLVHRVLLDALAGLEAAHRTTDDDGRPLNVVHRDVSPQNILIGVDGVARVTDFGIAKAAARLTSTRSGQVKGKVAYMAPEQARGRKVDARTDVFSIGVILWEALTGQRLFKRDNEAETYSRVVSLPIPRVRALLPDVPEAVDAVCARALERDPDRRFPTARQMGAALEEAVRAHKLLADPYEVGNAIRTAYGPQLTARRQAIRAAAGVEAMPPGQVMTTLPSGLTVPHLPDGGSRVAAAPTMSAWIATPSDTELPDDGATEFSPTPSPAAVSGGASASANASANSGAGAGANAADAAGARPNGGGGVGGVQISDDFDDAIPTTVLGSADNPAAAMMARALTQDAPTMAGRPGAGTPSDALRGVAETAASASSEPRVVVSADASGDESAAMPALPPVGLVARAIADAASSPGSGAARKSTGRLPLEPAGAKGGADAKGASAADARKPTRAPEGGGASAAAAQPSGAARRPTIPPNGKLPISASSSATTPDPAAQRARPLATRGAASGGASAGGGASNGASGAARGAPGGPPPLPPARASELAAAPPALTSPSEPVAPAPSPASAPAAFDPPPMQQPVAAPMQPAALVADAMLAAYPTGQGVPAAMPMGGDPAAAHYAYAGPADTTGAAPAIGMRGPTMALPVPAAARRVQSPGTRRAVVALVVMGVIGLAASVVALTMALRQRRAVPAAAADLAPQIAAPRPVAAPPLQPVAAPRPVLVPQPVVAPPPVAAPQPVVAAPQPIAAAPTQPVAAPPQPAPAPLPPPVRTGVAAVPNAQPPAVSTESSARSPTPARQPGGASAASSGGSGSSSATSSSGGAGSARVEPRVGGASAGSGATSNGAEAPRPTRRSRRGSQIAEDPPF